MTARTLLQNRIMELSHQKQRDEEHAAELKVQLDKYLNRATESEKEIGVLRETLSAMESLV